MSPPPLGTKIKRQYKTIVDNIGLYVYSKETLTQRGPNRTLDTDPEDVRHD